MRGGEGARPAGISGGSGCAAAATSKGPGGPAGCGNRRCLPREPPARPALGTPRSSPGPACARRPPPAGPGCPRPELGGRCRSPSHCHFHHDLEGFFLSSPGSQRAPGRGGGRVRSEGDGSLTQSADLRGEEQMVPLTPAAERAALRAPGSGR